MHDYNTRDRNNVQVIINGQTVLMQSHHYRDVLKIQQSVSFADLRVWNILHGFIPDFLYKTLFDFLYKTI